MAKLADAADLKSADPKGLWGFESPSRHQLSILNVLAGTDRRKQARSLLLGQGPVPFPCAKNLELIQRESRPF